MCISNSGKVNTGIPVIEMVKKVEKLGAGEILINSVEHDGTMKGFDLDLIQVVASCSSIPIIAAGGAGNYHDLYNALNAGAQAVSAASIFHFTERTPLAAKNYLRDKGIPVRINS